MLLAIETATEVGGAALLDRVTPRLEQHAKRAAMPLTTRLLALAGEVPVSPLLRDILRGILNRVYLLMLYTLGQESAIVDAYDKEMMAICAGERQADADFSLAPCDVVRQHAVQADGGEQSGEHSEGRGEARDQPLDDQRIAHPLVHGADTMNGEVWVHCPHAFPSQGHGRFRGLVPRNRLGHGRHSQRRDRHGRLCHD